MYRFLLHSLAFWAADAAIVKRWNVSENPTGTLDADAPKNCKYWASDITKDQLCVDLPKYFHMSMEDFVAMNPSLKSDCSGYQPGHSYCLALNQPAAKIENIQLKRRILADNPTAAPSVVTPSPGPSGTAASCTKTYKVQRGDICLTITQKYGLSLEQFMAWNPNVGKQCEYLIPGWDVCVERAPATSSVPEATPTVPATSSTSLAPTPTAPAPEAPVQPGTASGCQKWYQVQKNDTCDSVWIRQGITRDEFRKWNPQIDEECTNLWLGYRVCVGM